jgi:5-formyltetrahydrofolate cyclo-ligase
VGFLAFPSSKGGGRMKVLSKKELRHRIRNLRRSLPTQEYQQLSKAIVENIRSLEPFMFARVILAFCPFDGEPDISPLLEEILREGKDLLLPKVEQESMKLCKIGSLENLTPGSFCLLEPTQCEEVEPELVELALVPGVAFDLKGCRLGMGKGFYDRILGRIRGFKVGVAFSFQVFEKIPCDPWDQRVDAIATEETIIYRR